MLILRLRFTRLIADIGYIKGSVVRQIVGIVTAKPAFRPYKETP